MDRFSELKAFVSVVELGSFSAASEQLSVTKSSVSKKVAALEARLSTKLLNRTTRQLSVTELGTAYYERAKKIIRDWDDADALVSEGNETLVGTLKISAPVAFGTHHLKYVLKKYMLENENILLNINFSDRYVNIIEEGYDLSIRIGSLPDSNLMARKLAPIKRQLYASPTYIEKYGSPEKPEDLANHNMLNHVAMGKLLTFFDKEGNQSTVQPNIKLTINHSDMLVCAVADSIGLSILPTYATQQACQEKQIIPVMTDYYLPDASLYAVYPQTQYLSNRLRKLIDLMEEAYGEEPYWDATPQ